MYPEIEERVDSLEQYMKELTYQQFKSELSIQMLSKEMKGICLPRMETQVIFGRTDTSIVFLDFFNRGIRSKVSKWINEIFSSNLPEVDCDPNQK